MCKSIGYYIIHTVIITVIYFEVYLDLFIALEYNSIFQMCGVFFYHLFFKLSFVRYCFNDCDVQYMQ